MLNSFPRCLHYIISCFSRLWSRQLSGVTLLKNRSKIQICANQSLGSKIEWWESKFSDIRSFVASCVRSFSQIVLHQTLFQHTTSPSSARRFLRVSTSCIGQLHCFVTHLISWNTIWSVAIWLLRPVVASHTPFAKHTHQQDRSIDPSLTHACSSGWTYHIATTITPSLTHSCSHVYNNRL